jgi:hypothetical protein
MHNHPHNPFCFSLLTRPSFQGWCYLNSSPSDVTVPCYSRLSAVGDDHNLHRAGLHPPRGPAALPPTTAAAYLAFYPGAPAWDQTHQRGESRGRPELLQWRLLLSPDDNARAPRPLRGRLSLKPHPLFHCLLEPSVISDSDGPSFSSVSAGCCVYQVHGALGRGDASRNEEGRATDRGLHGHVVSARSLDRMIPDKTAGRVKTTAPQRGQGAPTFPISIPTPATTALAQVPSLRGHRTGLR